MVGYNRYNEWKSRGISVLDRHKPLGTAIFCGECLGHWVYHAAPGEVRLWCTNCRHAGRQGLKYPATYGLSLESCDSNVVLRCCICKNIFNADHFATSMSWSASKFPFSVFLGPFSVLSRKCAVGTRASKVQRLGKGFEWINGFVMLAAACLKRGEQNTKQNKPMAGSIGDTLVWYTVFLWMPPILKGVLFWKRLVNTDVIPL